MSKTTNLMVGMLLALSGLPALASTITITGSTPGGQGTISLSPVIGTPLTITGAALNDAAKTDFGICPSGCGVTGTLNIKTTGLTSFVPTGPVPAGVYLYALAGGSLAASGTYGPGMTPYSVMGSFLNASEVISTTSTPGMFSGSLSATLNPVGLSILGFGSLIPEGGSTSGTQINVQFSGSTDTGMISTSTLSLQVLPVSEPTSLSIVGIGLLGLGAGLRRKLLMYRN